MNITLFDRASYEITQREYTPEGFLKVPGRVARTGIQDYLASELKLPGDPKRIVKVYRPEEEVFKPESLSSYKDSDTTNDHPPEMVDANNFKTYTVGSVISEGTIDGDYVLADLIIKDAETIKLIESGKGELSAGYTAEYVKESGETSDGQKYEFIQRDIIINHVAVVDKARAGAMARIFDKNPEVKQMKVTLDNGRAVEVDEAVATQVEDCISRLNTEVQSGKDQIKVMQDASEKAKAEKEGVDEENEELKKKSSDKAIAAKVVDLMSAMDGARILAGAEFECDSSSPVAIKRAALTAYKESKDYSKESDAYISAAFDVEMEKKKEAEDEEEEEGKNSTDSHKQLAKDAAARVKTAADNKQKFNDSLTGGWKKTLGEE